MANEIFELRVREIIAELLSADIEKLSDTDDIMDDLGADSIDVLELICSLEEEFDISVPDADVINHRTVGDIVYYVVNSKKSS